ncbi:MAG: PDZ domain-containing protein [Cephaloticoccus sp.]
MKTQRYRLIPLLGFAVVASTLTAGSADEAPREVKQEKRVIMLSPHAAGTPEARHFEFIGEGPGETEKVTFLGVQTEPVGPALQAQLGLATGTGLAVGLVVPDSAAAGVLQEHDVLLKFNDQVLVNIDQLTVLVRNQKAGDKVALTFVRGGKEQKASVTLREHEVPKRQVIKLEQRVGPGFEWHGKAGPRLASAKAAGEADNLMWMMNVGREGGARHVVRTIRDADDTVFVSVNTGRSAIELKDEAGTLELVTKDGKRVLTATDAKGNVTFSGPVDTEEDKAKLPADLKTRFEKLEEMPNVQFRTDDNFEGGETEVIKIPGREARLQAPRAVPGLRRLDVS